MLTGDSHREHVKSGSHEQAVFTFVLMRGTEVVVLSLFLIRSPLAAIVAAVKGAVSPISGSGRVRRVDGGERYREF